MADKEKTKAQLLSRIAKLQKQIKRFEKSEKNLIETDRSKTEKQVQDLARFPSENPYPVIRISRDGVLLYVNEASQLFVQEWSAGVGKLVPPYIKQIVSESFLYDQIRKIDLKSGDREYLFTVVPLSDSDYVNLYGLDITEYKEADEELKQHRDRLQQMVEERTFNLVRAVNDLQKEIRERKEVEARLKEVVKYKSDFLANMSHELRTPLNSIVGYTDLVLKDKKVSLLHKRRENLENILLSADTLLTLIGNILDMSKVEKGKVELHHEKVELPALIDYCVNSAQGLLKGKAIEIIRDISSDIPELQTDKAKLHQIISNLLSNAVKFTEKGRVNITARLHPKKEGYVNIIVHDTGIGISKEKFETIFEQFKQIDDSPTRKYGGVGMGLAVVKSYLDLIGGEITVESEVGKGATFIATLPVSSL